MNTEAPIDVSNNKVCPTRLIEDTPEEQDLLAGGDEIGPHERVARTIGDIIRSLDETGGKVIGLEGGWGAGKTTVINMLKKQFKDKEDIAILSFDAWAHEGDPLRRTFLESLIIHFQKLNNWIDKSKWDKRLEKLSNRRKETTIRTNQQTTVFGKIFAISLILIPVGSPLLAAALKKGVAIDSMLDITWMFIVGLLLTTAPLLVITLNFLRTIKRGRDKGLSDSDRASDWSFLSGSSVEEVKQDIAETPDPTSIEFESEFRCLMRDALPDGTDRLFVLVIDNLDRIDQKEALIIWSTLQTFLQDRSSDIEKWFEKLWIIVPYDPSGLRKIWDGSSVQKTSDNTGKVVSDSFIDKSFQLRFEVPPPVLSNWKAYLSKLVGHALPMHSEEDRHAIYRVMNFCRDIKDGAPTPRELKMYVNQIGAIHRQWGHEFPIDHVAYYVILRRKFVTIREMLLNGELPYPNIKTILSSNLEANIAGMVFNVKAHLGQQLLLGDPIYNALTTKNIDSLSEIKEHHKDGFWAILEEVATTRLVEDIGASSVANAAICLEDSNVLKGAMSSEKNAIIGGLGRAISNTSSWAPLTESISEGLIKACGLVSDLNVSIKIMANLRLTIRKLSEEDAPISEVIAGLVGVCETIDAHGHKNALTKSFMLSGDAKNWIGVCVIIARHKQKWWPYFKPQVPFAEVAASLNEIVVGASFTSQKLDAIRVTNKSFAKCNWDELAVAMGARLTAGQSWDAIEANALLNGLSILAQDDNSKAKTVLNGLATAGHLMHGFNQMQSQGSSECKARYIAAFLGQVPDASLTQAAGDSAAGLVALQNMLNTDDIDIAMHIVAILRDLDNLNLLFEIIDKRGKYDMLLTRCLRLVADRDDSEIIYSSAEVVHRWQDLWSNLDDDENKVRFEELIGYLCEKSSFADYVMQETDDGFNYEDAGLYFVISDNFQSDSFRDWCRSGIEVLSSKAWEKELDNNGYALMLMRTLVEKGRGVSLTTPYQDALVSHAEKVIEGRAVPPDDLVLHREKIFIGLGEGDARTVLRRRLRDVVMIYRGKINKAFFELYGDEISDPEILNEDSKVVAKLFSPLIQERNIGGIRWMDGVISNHQDLLDKCDDTIAVGDFYERLQSELINQVDEEDEAHTLICNIASILGLQPVQETSEVVEENASDEPNNSRE
ncbi:MAG: hypothetical protein GXP14_07695 [Gammaproteobacteria bacterium]|nr:hypothetical protein [Gammaproteobacteria bacterium]